MFRYLVLFYHHIMVPGHSESETDWTYYWTMNLCPLVVEGFLFGLYTGCFVLYLYIHAMNTLKDSDAKKNVLVYPLWMLYCLSTVNFLLDIMDIFTYFSKSPVLERLLQYCLQINIQIATSSFYNFISQSILIYRCWIVWGRRTSVTIVPLLLAFAALGTTLSQIGGQLCNIKA
ncbi:hypothetical protein BYT27DRAFT_7337862, partial [Phlegmacium glaucopus]